jgi:transposase
LLDSGCTDKTDPHDARAAAIVALRHSRLRRVTPVDHTAVLRLLADRHHDLTGLRTQAICRLHALLCGLTPGRADRLLSAPQAGADPARRPAGRAGRDRTQTDRTRVGRRRPPVRQPARRHQPTHRRGRRRLSHHGHRHPRHRPAIGTAIILGHSGDIARFPTSGHFARYTGTAPIATSSRPQQRHRLNPGGNRQLNRALHVAAVTQVRNNTPGRAYYQRKLDEGKSPKEALPGPQTPDRQDRLPPPGRRRSPLKQQWAREGKRDDSQSRVTGLAP